MEESKKVEVSSPIVVQMVELVNVFMVWGLSQGDAIRLALPLTFPSVVNAYCEVKELKSLVNSFRQEQPCTSAQHPESCAE